MNSSPQPELQPRRVVRTVKVVLANSLHTRLSLFDQHGANIGFLTTKPEDAPELIGLLQPERFIVPKAVYLRNRGHWNLPHDCKITHEELLP